MADGKAISLWESMKEPVVLRLADIEAARKSAAFAALKRRLDHEPVHDLCRS